MKFSAFLKPALLAGSLLVVLPAQALVIEFDYRYDTKGFFTDALTGELVVERRARLAEAASFYSGFTDTIAAIAPQVGDTWSVKITHPGLGGSQITLTDMAIRRPRI